MDALIVVDYQEDFISGSLAAPGAKEILPAIRSLIERFPLVIASGDFHPADHMSFKEQGGPWPAHCVVDTPGAELHPEVKEAASVVVMKGTHRDTDSYSAFGADAFDGPAGADLSLRAFLRARGVQRVWVCGLVTEVCVQATVIDARGEGFDTWVVTKGCASLDEGDAAEAISAMVSAGALVVV